MSTSKFKIGDKIKVVGYHSILTVSKTSTLENQHVDRMVGMNMYRIVGQTDTLLHVDTWPHMIGTTGTIRDIINVQGIYRYALDEIDIPQVQDPTLRMVKSAWYNENQLEYV